MAGRYDWLLEGLREEVARRQQNPHAAVLGLSGVFTQDDVKVAYRQRARETHPDAGGNAEAFRRVREAYEALTQEPVVVEPSCGWRVG